VAKASKQKKRQGGGPYLDAALICEDLVQEKDFVVSAIRLVNRITAHEPKPEPGVFILLPLGLFIRFHSGDVTGERQLSLYWITPSRKRIKLQGFPQPQTLAFEGGDTGVVRSFPLHLPYEADGTYWIDVVLDKKRYTRVPLTIKTGDKPPGQE
jgi:hypothetical protein